MLVDERRARILKEIELRGVIRVTAFAARTGLSAMTIRRDLAALSGSGLVKRIYGGAVAPAVRTLEVSAGTPRVRRQVATFGMVVPSASYYFPGIIRGAEQAAAERGIRLVLAVSEYSEDEERRLIARLLGNDVDGLLITPVASSEFSQKTFELLAKAPVPSMIVERVIEGFGTVATLSGVRSDHATGAELALSHLVELGHRRIALVTRNSVTAHQVRAGFRHFARQLLATGSWYEEKVSPVEAGIDALRQDIGRVLDRCTATDTTAVLVLPDDAAVMLAGAAQDRGMRIPEDLAVVAYDDEIASLAAVPLTAVAPPRFEVGYLAVEQLFNHISTGPQGNTSPTSRITLGPVLNVRESTVWDADDASVP